MSDSAQIRRALVQKLESLHRSGVRGIPRTVITPTTPSSAKTATPASLTQRSVAASPTKGVGPTFSATASEPAAAASEPMSGHKMTDAESSSALQILAAEVAVCTRCPELATARKQTVFGVGNQNARLVFFGEAPGADEDRLGEPFVGKAGQLLTKIIEACTLRREDVYIMNVLKCRPPANRNPTPGEALNCRPFFEQQFEILQPEFICCLGAIAATTLLNTTDFVGQLRGRFHDWRGIKVLVTYHPSYLLRNAGAKKLVWADMKLLMKEMGIQR